MKSRAVLTSIAVLFFGLAIAEEKPKKKPSTYTDGLYGFTIQAPSFSAVAKGSMVIPVMLLGPAENAFSSNVNVVVQETAMTREEYRKVTFAQIEAARFKVISEKNTTVSKKDALLIEYEGEQQGRDLRWLALAVFAGERVHVVTCTALMDSYAKQEAAFKECIDSFQLAN